ncbi:MAG: bacteriocin [Bacillota bacterium]
MKELNDKLLSEEELQNVQGGGYWDTTVTVKCNNCDWEFTGPRYQAHTQKEFHKKDYHHESFEETTQ